MNYFLLGIAFFFACTLAIPPTDSREKLDVPECPTDGYLGIPVFPGMKVYRSTTTTRGAADRAVDSGETPASPEVVLAFYIKCLRSVPELDGWSASFARPYPYNKSVWGPGKGPDFVELDAPEGLCDTIRLTPEGEGTRISILTAYPYGLGHRYKPSQLHNKTPALTPPAAGVSSEPSRREP